MNAVTSVLIGFVVGLAWGWLLRGLRATPLVQSILAFQLSWIFGGFATGLIWMMRASRHEGIAAVSFGLSEMMIAIVVLAALGGAVYASLGLVSKGRPNLLRNGPIILGIIGGICGSLALAYLGRGQALQP